MGIENLLNLSPAQTFLLLFLNLWVVVIFPLLVIRKLNYLTRLVESQFEDGEPEEKAS